MPILCSLFAAAAIAAPAQAAKKPTVASELKRLAGQGLITPEAAAADRAAYGDARTRLKKLTGARARELGGVLRDLDDMAARRQFTPSRLNPLFLTLRRNVEWWTAQPLLWSGQRVGFPDSELVFQFYPGHGIQIQWLGTFGKLNAYWSGGSRNNARASRLVDEIEALASERAGGLAWEYLFPFGGQRPPWVSSLAQGTGLQSLARSGTRLKRQADVFPIALAGMRIFEVAPPAGVRLRDGAGAHYLQYSGLSKLRILNGFIQSLVGLYDFTTLTGDPTAQALFDAGDLVARAEVPTFDTGAWSLYSRGSITRESDLGYHKLLRDFLVQLCRRTAAVEYCGAADNFTAYLTTPPALEVLRTTSRPKKPGTLRFKLSKISRVTLRVTRDDATVATLSPGLLSYGTKTLVWKAPKRTGDYDVTVTATDLAGNAATAVGTVSVKPRG